MLKLSNKLKNLFAKSRPTKVLLESSRPKKLKNLLLDFYPWLKNKKMYEDIEQLLTNQYSFLIKEEHIDITQYYDSQPFPNIQKDGYKYFE